MKCYSIQKRFFLKYIVLGSQDTLYPRVLSETKLYSICCLEPFNTLPSITQHFEWILSIVFEYKIFSLV